MRLFKLILKKATTFNVVRFFLFLYLCSFSLLVSATIAASEDESRYIFSLTPYRQNVSFKESEKQQVYNSEKGRLTGINATLSYHIDDWQLSFSGEKSRGTLQYFGQTQLGRELSTKTNIENSVYELSLEKELWDLTTTTCLFCGKFSAFIALSYDSVHRDILSKANVSGLSEQYSFSLAELGANWKAKNLLFVDWQLSLSHAQAMNARLDVNFLSSYNKTSIPLNNVYVNQAELVITYTVATNIDIGLILN